MDDKFKKYLEKLLKKNENSELAIYIKNCLVDYDKNNQPIPANIGNNISTGWSNPFGGTSWGL